MEVQFEENNIARKYESESVPKLAGWLIEKGLAKDVSGANKLQVVAAVIFIALAVYFAF